MPQKPPLQGTSALILPIPWRATSLMVGETETQAINSFPCLQSRMLTEMVAPHHTDQLLSTGFRFKSIWRHWLRASLSKMSNYTKWDSFPLCCGFVGDCSMQGSAGFLGVQLHGSSLHRLQRSMISPQSWSQSSVWTRSRYLITFTGLLFYSSVLPQADITHT